jgi:hypothetical protein
MRTKAIILVGTLMLIAESLFADPANPALRKRIKLEDGRTVTACMVGDEYGYYWKDVNDGLCYLETTGSDRFHEVDAEAIMKAAKVRRIEDAKKRFEMATQRKAGIKMRNQARSDARLERQPSLSVQTDCPIRSSTSHRRDQDTSTSAQRRYCTTPLDRHRPSRSLAT